MCKMKLYLIPLLVVLFASDGFLQSPRLPNLTSPREGGLAPGVLNAELERHSILEEEPLDLQKDCPTDMFMIPKSNRCFKLTSQRMSWDSGLSSCASEGLVIARPADNIATDLRKYILDTYKDDQYIWIGGRGDGRKQAWKSDGSAVHRDLLWPGAESEVTTDRCLAMYAFEDGVSSYPNRPYTTYFCSDFRKVLCEDISGIDELSIPQKDTPCDLQAGYGYSPHPTRCNKYLQCVHNKWEEHSCNPNTAWSQSLLTCNWVDNVDCRQYSTPATPTIAELSRSDFFFQCPNGKEIFRKFVCDGDDDCGDGADEINCIDKCGICFIYDDIQKKCVEDQSCKPPEVPPIAADKWRNDSRCGWHSLAPNGGHAQCDPESSNPCCSFGRCSGSENDCKNGIDYRDESLSCEFGFIYDDIQEICVDDSSCRLPPLPQATDPLPLSIDAGDAKWRNDSRCSPRIGREHFFAPNGEPAQCNPEGLNPCCSEDGWCGSSCAHCKCHNCIDYRDKRLPFGLCIGYNVLQKEWVEDLHCSNDKCRTGKLLCSIIGSPCFTCYIKNENGQCINNFTCGQNPGQP